MASSKALKLGRKSALSQRDVLVELDALMKSIARGEKMILELKEEMELVGTKHQHRKTTRDDIAYLEDLLRLREEEAGVGEPDGEPRQAHAGATRKVLRDDERRQNPPDGEVRAGIMRALQSIQGAMERLDKRRSSSGCAYSVCRNFFRSSSRGLFAWRT